MKTSASALLTLILLPSPAFTQIVTSGGSPRGTAGGALIGAYPSPTLRYFLSVKDYGAIADEKSDSTCSITSGTAVLSCTSAPFTNSDVGKSVSVLLAQATATVTSLTLGANGTSTCTTTSTVSFSGGGGSGAAATSYVISGVVKGFTITNPGSGYTSAPTVTIAQGGCSVQPTATAAITKDELNTTILSVQSASTVTLNANAGATVGPTATVIWGTDNSAAISSAFTAASNAGGGTLCVPPALLPYRVDSQIVVPNDGGASPVPKQKTMGLAVCGGGGKLWWYQTTLQNQTAAILDLRYNGSGHKIETYGNGGFLLSGLTLEDTRSSDQVGFFHTTNTTVTVQENTFIGTGNAAQDFVILGGSTTSLNGTETAGFQGYGSRVSSNTFTRGNRAVLLQTFANDVIINDNALVHNTGTRAFQCDGSVNGGGGMAGNLGNIFRDNVIEMDTYMFGFILDNCTSNQFIGNGFQDEVANGNEVARYYLYDGFSSSKDNLFADSVKATAKKDFIGNCNALQYQTIIGSAAGRISGSCANATTIPTGVVGNEFVYGIYLKSAYDTTKNLPGGYMVSDPTNVGKVAWFNWDDTHDQAVIDANLWNGGAAKPVVLAPGSGLVGIGSSAGVRDTGLDRNGAGLLEVNNGTSCSTAGNCRDLKARHTLGGGTAPTLTVGTGTVAGSDEAGRVTLTASSQATITVTFGTTYTTNIPICAAFDETTAANNPIQPQPTLATLVLNATGTFGAADKISWLCRGY